MRRWIIALVVCIGAHSAMGQAVSQQYQPATITAVVLHKDDEQNPAKKTSRYEVTLITSDATYVVLYEPPPDSKIVEYTVGQDLLVRSGDKTLTFTKLGMSEPTHEVTILRRETRPSKTGIDWSRARTDYYSEKMKHLSDELALSPDQQTKLKPILEQEASEVAQITFNPVMSDKAKLKRFEDILRASDDRLQPILTSEQWQRLQSMRVDQKQELKRQLEKSKG